MFVDITIFPFSSIVLSDEVCAISAVFPNCSLALTTPLHSEN